MMQCQVWFDSQFDFDLVKFVFIDEIGLNMKMVWLCGWFLKGECCWVGVFYGYWKMIIFIGVLCLIGMMVLMVFDGVMNGVVFLVYVEQVFVFNFLFGDIVVMDNLFVYKVVGVWEVIESVDVELCYLLFYSFDFNLIEMVFLKFKVLLCVKVECIVDVLWNFVGDFIFQFKI